MRQKQPWLIAVVIVLAVGTWWFLIRDTAPPAPDIGSAAEVAAAAQMTTTTAAPTTTTAAPTTTTAAPTTTTAAPTTTTAASVAVPGDPSGIWEIDTAIGDYGDFTSTFVGFRVGEELGRGIGSTTAVGRTPQVAGTVELDGTVIIAAEITADLRGLRTDRSFRDSKVQEALNTDSHPEAIFILDGPVDLGDVSTSAEVSVPGTLSVNGINQSVNVELSADLVGDVLAVVGTFDVIFADYGVEVPSASIVIAVEDHGVVEVQLFLTR
ncbi:MAG TPA: YceI family protein [Acidimicrobiales bacterium]|nr:YceI family protein [Acidimicrobiales bacterium]